MKKLTIVLTAGLLLSACSDGGNNQSQPIDNTPPGAAAPAQTDADPTPQTGSGGQSPVESPTGTEKR